MNINARIVDQRVIGIAAQFASELGEIYGERKISLQQLSATFRRGDLLEFL